MFFTKECWAKPIKIETKLKDKSLLNFEPSLDTKKYWLDTHKEYQPLGSIELPNLFGTNLDETIKCWRFFLFAFALEIISFLLILMSSKHEETLLAILIPLGLIFCDYKVLDYYNKKAVSRNKSDNNEGTKQNKGKTVYENLRSINSWKIIYLENRLSPNDIEKLKEENKKYSEEIEKEINKKGLKIWLIILAIFKIGGLIYFIKGISSFADILDIFYINKSVLFAAIICAFIYIIIALLHYKFTRFHYLFAKFFQSFNTDKKEYLGTLYRVSKNNDNASIELETIYNDRTVKNKQNDFVEEILFDTIIWDLINQDLLKIKELNSSKYSIVHQNQSQTVTTVGSGYYPFSLEVKGKGILTDDDIIGFINQVNISNNHLKAYIAIALRKFQIEKILPKDSKND